MCEARKKYPWLVINQQDGNDSFEVQAADLEEAALAGLSALGWSLVAPDGDDGDDESSESDAGPEECF